MIKALKKTGILVGKPIDEIYYDEYKFILVEEINDKNLPVVYNINVGHSQLHCIIPLGIKCTVDVNVQTIIFYK